MATNRVSPYTRLMQQVHRFASDVKHPRTRCMWVYPKAKLSESWSLADLAQRVQAADQLGYDVRLRHAEDGLRVEYVKRPNIPLSWA